MPTAASAWLLLGAADKSGDTLLATVGPEGISETEDTYTSLGSGSAYAEYVLSRLYTDSLTIEQGLECAVYTIEEVKKVDPDCGGPVRVVAVTKDGVQARSVDDLRDLVNKLQIRDDLLAKMWRSMVLGNKSPEDITGFLSAGERPTGNQ